jgi:HD-GYP domain-containing protein (c-di-GMP phosphodiesterase class II)
VIARAQLRTIDIVGRFGGEEFVALLPQTSHDSALVAAERLRAALASEPVSADGTLHLTCSIGVAVFPEDASDRGELLEAADRAMYGAKRLGRNQTLAASDPAVGALQATGSDWGLDRPGALAQAVEGLAMLVDIRDSYTDQHAGEVSTLARAIAGHLGCRADASQDVALAARLHDIGKVAIPDAILRKAGSLTDEEWKLIKTHPRVGADVVERIPLLGGLAPIIGAHHERWDGRGYPDGLAGESIPLAARIIAVADAFNAMTTKRPYRDALPIEVAMEELERGAGSQFDPTVVRATIEILAAHAHGAPDQVSAPANG